MRCNGVSPGWIETDPAMAKAVSGGTGTWDAADVAWTTATITAKYAVLVRRAGGSLVSGDLLIAYCDLNPDSGSATISSTGATFTVAMNASGIMTVTANAS